MIKRQMAFTMAVIVGVAALAAPAFAQGKPAASSAKINIPAQCAAMKNKIGCACALNEANGWVRGNAGWRYGDGGANINAFSSCMKRNGAG